MDRPPHISINDGRVIFPENRFVRRFSGRSDNVQVSAPYPKMLCMTLVLTGETIGDVKE